MEKYVDYLEFLHKRMAKNYLKTHKIAIQKIIENKAMLLEIDGVCGYLIGVLKLLKNIKQRN